MPSLALRAWLESQAHLIRSHLHDAGHADPMTIEAADGVYAVRIVVDVVRPEPAPAALTKIERAREIFLRNPNQSIREVARQVPCSPALLSRNEAFQRLRQAHVDQLPHHEIRWQR